MDVGRVSFFRFDLTVRSGTALWLLPMLSFNQSSCVRKGNRNENLILDLGRKTIKDLM